MLKDKPIALLALVVVLLAAAFSASVFYCESSYTDCEKQRRQSYTRVPEVALSPILLGDSKAPPKQEQAGDTAEQATPPCPRACQLVIRTSDDPVALLTALLGLILAVQLAWMARQEKILRESVDSVITEAEEPTVAATPAAAESATPDADALVIGQMPVLSPYITDMAKLHPVVMDGGKERIDFRAIVRFTFENLGKTPGIIREVRADLFLTDGESVPTVSFDKLHQHDAGFVIPGDARGASARTSVIEHQQAFSLRRAEFEELTNDTTGPYRRFALIGQVKYDDLFGWRHTRTFCVNMRVWGQPPAIRTFQSQHGGLPFNRFRRERIAETARA